MRHFNSADEFTAWLKTGAADIDEWNEVWRHADGSYIVGYWFEFDENEDDDDYAHEGTVAEWIEQLSWSE